VHVRELRQVMTIYGGTSEIMKTIIAREITGLRT
jgi:alkylation response protein AidB-like acyl-CoA dehydrogenase